MLERKKSLIESEQNANYLYEEIKLRGLVSPGKTERQLNYDITNLFYELFGTKKYWHKRIVRAGKNTLEPYQINPPDILIQTDDIVFFDFGPVFGNWEADIGRTFVLGQDENKIKLKRDIELAWKEGKQFYDDNRFELTGADFYKFTTELAEKYGWQYGNNHCGHLIGEFPHEKIIGEEVINYIHPDNNELMCNLDKNGNERFWIYEIHFVDVNLKIGGFFEQLVS